MRTKTTGLCLLQLKLLFIESKRLFFNVYFGYAKLFLILIITRLYFRMMVKKLFEFLMRNLY